MKKLFLFLIISCFPVILMAQNLLLNPGFESGDADGNGVPNDWIGYAQAGASMQLMNDSTSAYSGSYWSKCTSTNGGYYLLYQNSFPAKSGDVWEFSAFIKDISPAFPGASYAALKISAKNASGGTFKYWEVYYDSVTSEWTKFSNIQTMPEGTAFIQAVIVVHGADAAPEAVYGFDQLSLELIYENPITPPDTTALLANPGFEDGDQDGDGKPDGWIGYAQAGASMELIKSSTSAYNGAYWVKCTSTNGGYYLLYQNSFPAKPGDVWEFSSFIKDISPAYPGSSYAALKISAKNASGGTFKYWEEFQDVTSYWKKFTNTQTMPEGTAYIQVVLVVHGADGAPEASYGFDDVNLALIYENPITPPDTTSLLANPGFEDGDQDGDGKPDGWIGYAQAGASMELMKSNTTAYNGAYWAKCTSTNGGYYLLYQNSFPAKPGDVWEFSSFIKDVSPSYPGASYAALKISAKNASGGTFKYWEEYQDVTDYWKKYSNIQTMPENTAYIQVVIVVHGADGAPEAAYGFDDVNAKLIYENPVPHVDTNYLANAGFEDGDQDGDAIPDGWIGYAQSGASMELVKSSTTAYNGAYWTKCTSTNGGYYLLYQNSFPAKPGDVWEFSSFIKDISPLYPGASFAALKISAKNASGGTFKAWEEYQEVTDYWKKFSNKQTMPEGTAFIQAVIVVHGADGAPEASYGFDDVGLHLIDQIPIVPDENNLLANPGFEDGDQDSDGIPDGWIGYAQTGASMELVKSATTAYNGSQWVKCTSTNGGYYLLYQNSFPAKPGDVFKFSSFIKDVSPAFPGANYAALKISAKNASGGTFKYWEEFQNVTGYWKSFSNIQTMPEGTAFIQAVIVVHGADGAPEASYGFDDVSLELIYEHAVVSPDSNYYVNPGFEDGDQDGDGIPDGWIGYAQTGASMELVKSNTSAYNGSQWAKCTSTNGGYYLLYQNTIPSKPGDAWLFSSFIKDVSPAYPGASFVALKLTAKTSSGSNIKVWEIFQDSVTTYWKRYTNAQVMPPGTGLVQAVIVVHGADGAPEASYGFDDVRLELKDMVIAEPEGYNILSNGGFEDGDQDGDAVPDGWIGFAQNGASMELINSVATAYEGKYWAKCTSTLGGYYLLYQNAFPAEANEVWKFSSFIKDLSPVYPGECYAALKITAKTATGSNIQVWEVFQDTVTGYWKQYTNIQKMPEGTAQIQAVIVIHGADGAPEATYGFDKVSLELIHEMTDNPGFESGDSTADGIPNGWLGGGTADTHVETIRDANGAHSGDHFAKVTVDKGNGWYVLYQQGFPAKQNEIWSLRAFIKDVSPDSLGDFAFLKISAKDSTGSNLKVWEILQEGVSRNWKDYSITETMPAGTALIQPVLVVKKQINDGKEASYGFDDIRVVKLGIDTSTTGVDDETVVYSYELKQNYPNPFNPATTILFSLEKPGNVTLRIFDVVGQEVMTLVDGFLKAGKHQVNFNAIGLASGMYLYRIESGTFNSTKKMILLK